MNRLKQAASIRYSGQCSDRLDEDVGILLEISHRGRSIFLLPNGIKRFGHRICLASMNSTLSSLIRVNVLWLEQAIDLLAAIDDLQFSEVPPGFAPHKASGHLRHILEFYECFLAGLAVGRIDYDSRKRDLSIESSRLAATARVRLIISRLCEIPGDDCAIRVNVEDTESIGLESAMLSSSVGRELQTLSSHTIHHFALIAMTLRANGVRLDPRFGMAPSTLRYQDRLKSEAA
jgi:hypothetical protein